MKRSTTSFSLILVVFIACSLLSPTAASAKIHKLTILHTSDHRGHFMKFNQFANPDIGGMAARSTLINIARAEAEQAGGHILLLSAGNVNIGTPESDLLNAEPDFKLMNMLGYDAMTLGNLEFSHPREVLMKQREWADFPFLSANIVKKDTGELLDFVEPYIMKEFDGLRVAIFGLTPEETPNAAEYAKDVNARSVIEIAKVLVPELRRKADLIIALSNIGFYGIPGAGYRTTGDAQLAKEISGIDIIIGRAYSRNEITEPEVIGETLIVQTGEYGLHIGRLDVTIDDETDTLLDFTSRSIPINLKKRIKYQDKSYYMFADNGYVEDPAILEFIQPYLKQTEELLSEPIGEALVDLIGEKKITRSQETNVANLLTDSMRAKTGAEIAFFNAGGIIAGIEKGQITYRGILKVCPFGDTLVLMDMTGEQVLEVLNHAATINSGSGRFVHVSGLTWTKHKGIAEDVVVGGAPIEPDRIYKVVTGDFMAGGGDGYSMFKDIPQFDTGFTDASALREYIMKKGEVAPKFEGRLTIIE